MPNDNEDSGQVGESITRTHSQFFKHLTETPTLAVFYIPLMWPIGIPPVARFTLFQKELIPWENDVVWPDWMGLAGARTKANFVLLSLYRYSERWEYDTATATSTFSLVREHFPELFTENDPLEFGRVPLPQADVTGTIAQLITPIFAEHQEKDVVSIAFDRCIEELNRFESMYMLTSGDFRVRHTNRVTCWPYIPTVFADVESGNAWQWTLFRVNHGNRLIKINDDDLPIEKVREIAVRMSAAMKRDQLLVYSDRAFAARRALEEDGDYGSAIIWCHTAGEILLDTLLLMLAWEELTYFKDPVLSKEEVIRWFSSNNSIASRIRSCYSHRLRGNWYQDDPQTPTSRWIHTVSRLRNRVVHAGYAPRETEARTCLGLLNELETFVKDLLASDQNRNRYPRTALMVMGGPGLRRRGAFTKYLTSILESSQEDWQHSFSEFRDWFDNALDETFRPGIRQG